MPVRPQIPKQPLATINFYLLGLLLDGPKDGNDLMRELREVYSWNPRSGKGAALAALRRFTSDGIVARITFPNGTNYWQLLDAGFKLWKEAFDFQKATVSHWQQQRTRRYASNSFPKSTRFSPPEVTAAERSPSPHEQDAIIRHASPSFRSIFEFSVLNHVRAVDLANARIESITAGDRRILNLEETSISGRTIKKRGITINEGRSEKIVSEAIARRKSGLIFLRRNQTPWTEATLSTEFRRVKRRAGVPEDVKLSGRGGRVGTQIEADHNH